MCVTKWLNPLCLEKYKPKSPTIANYLFGTIKSTSPCL